MLCTLTLDCPRLESLDATFCYRLGNHALAWIPRCRPPLQRLFLGLCTQIDAQALHVLSSLGSLRSLDLSYTEIRVSCLMTACDAQQKVCPHPCDAHSRSVRCLTLPQSRYLPEGWQTPCCGAADCTPCACHCRLCLGSWSTLDERPCCKACRLALSRARSQQ